VQKDDDFVVEAIVGSKSSSERMWIVLNYFENYQSNKVVALHCGDIFRLGKVKLHFKEFSGDDQSRYAESCVTCRELLCGSLSSPASNEVYIETQDVDFTLMPETCRICLNEDIDDEENPLISPCKCTGTLKHIHLNCLKLALESRCQVTDKPGVQKYTWRSLTCELCQSNFPVKMRVNSTEVSLLKYAPRFSEYLVLEELKRKQAEVRVVYYVVDLTCIQTVNFGRSIENEIAFEAELSVSRFHSYITYRDGGVYLRDNGSKFGTLVQCLRPIRLLPEERVLAQFGRTVLGISLESAKPRRRCCFLGLC
jgi:hypothetical protein